MIGTRVKSLRKLSNMTMKELAQMIDVSEATVSRYESNERTPENETLLKLSSVLNAPLDYFFDKGLFAKRELIEEYHDIIIESISQVSKGVEYDYVSMINKLDFERFLIFLYYVIHDVEYNVENNTLNVCYHLDGALDTGNVQPLKKEYSVHEHSIISRYRTLDDRGKANVDNTLEAEYQFSLKQLKIQEEIQKEKLVDKQETYEPTTIAAHNEGEWTDANDRDVARVVEMSRRKKEREKKM